MSNKKWKMGQVFVAFSEYLNFNFIEQCSTELNACYRAVSKDHEYWRTIYYILFILYKLLKRLIATTYPKLQNFIQKLSGLFLFQKVFCWGTFEAKSWITYKGCDTAQVRPKFVQRSFNTSYLTDSYIIFTLKMESVSKNIILA